MLAARPLHNAAASERTTDDQHVLLTVRKHRPAWLVPPLTWWIKPRLTTTVELDPLGARVWALCDGRRTVEEIIERLAGELDLSFHEGRVAVTNYLKMLVQRGVLVITMPGASATDDEATAPTHDASALARPATHAPPGGA